MARQTTSLSESFAGGGDKEGEKEQLFFAIADRIDPEWAVFDLLRGQIDTLTDVINANDNASGSYATNIGILQAASSSFENRTTANELTARPTATANRSVELSVTKTDRGVYALVFTMVDSGGRSDVTKTATIALE